MGRKRRPGRAARVFLVLAAVIVLAAGADTLRQVYRFGNVRIDLKDGGVRTYKLESVEIETISGGNLQRWKRTYVFAEKASTSSGADVDDAVADTVKIEYSHNSMNTTFLFIPYTRDSFFKDQWKEMEFIKVLPRDVFWRDCWVLLVLGMMTLCWVDIGYSAKSRRFGSVRFFGLEDEGGCRGTRNKGILVALLVWSNRF